MRHKPIDVNETFLGTLGFSRDEVIGKTSTKLDIFADSVERTRLLEILKRDGAVRGMELDVKTKDGSLRHGLFSADPIYIGRELCLLTVMVDITERRQMEGALRQSEEKYRTVANFTFDWEAWRAPDGSYLYISPSCERISGYSPEEFQNDPVLIIKIAHPLDRVVVAEHFDFNSRQCCGPDVQMDFRIITRSGETRWLSHHCIPVFDKDGRCLGRRESNRDITDRKLAEQSLQTQNRYFSVLYEILLDLLNRRNQDELLQAIVNHVAVLFDAPYVELMLEKDGELVVQTFTQLQPVSKGERVKRGSARLSWQAFDTKLPAVLDDYATYAHRRDIYSRLKVHAVADFPILVADRCVGVLALGRSLPGYVFDDVQVHNGILFAQLAALVLDNAQLFSNLENEIAERRHVEQELKLQRDFVTQILNTMGQGLTVTNEQSVFEFVNPAYARLFGYTVEDLIGKTPSDLTIPEDRDALEKQRSLRMAGKVSSYESRLRRPDGSVAHVLITGAPREIDGHYAGAIAVITDLTDQKKVEEELRRAKAELEMTNRKLEQALTREQQLARTDAQTGLNNRGFLFLLAERKLATALRYQLPFSVILFDIDHFKQVNDIYGHAVGDLAIQRITEVVCGTIRAADVIGRYGGDEFLILLPHSTALEAVTLAERIHANIVGINIDTPRGALSLTVSMGIADLVHNPPDTLEALFLRVDQALYSAKKQGRNRTFIYKKGVLLGEANKTRPNR